MKDKEELIGFVTDVRQERGDQGITVEETGERVRLPGKVTTYVTLVIESGDVLAWFKYARDCGIRLVAEVEVERPGWIDRFAGLEVD